MNSDDVYFHPSVISLIVQEFDKNQNIDVIYGDVATIDSEGKIMRIRHLPEFNYNKLLRYDYISQPATFFKRRVIKEEKLDQSLKYSMDYEYLLRLGKKYVFKHIPLVLAGDRNHKERKIIKGFKKQKEESLKIKEKYGAPNGVPNWIMKIIDSIMLRLSRLKGLKEILILKTENLAFNAKKAGNTKTLVSQLFGRNKRLGV